MARLGDFERTRQFVAARYRLVSDRPLIIEVCRPGSDDVARLELAMETGIAWLVAAVPVCNENEVNPMAALRYNATLAVGSLAVDGGRCVIRNVLRMSNLSEEALIDTLDRLWRQAARLRAGKGAEATLQDLFVNLSD